MTRVLIIGATGYIGRTLADALVRSGQHQVWGVTRNADKAKALALGEIRPVIAEDPFNKPAAWIEAIHENNIDVVVDVSPASPDQEKVFALLKTIGAERIEKNNAPGGWGARGPKLGYIFTSGTWMYGSRKKQVNEFDLIGAESGHNPASAVAWRPALDKSILAARDVLDVAIVRPALIYGRESTIWSSFFLPLLEAGRQGSTETVEIPLEAEALPSLVHIDDVASGFQLAIEKLSLVNGGSVFPVFDLVTSQESMATIFSRLAAAWGVKGGVRLTGTGGNMLSEAMSTSNKASNGRARQLLGWEPRKLDGMVGGIDLVAAAFASQY
ncbi:NAD dependent epimerase/dehydratase family protein [Sarocladium implicatum]|nr:NAD dependent epimerase/dehydratase family protein [Sarocladium implicatum]